MNRDHGMSVVLFVSITATLAQHDSGHASTVTFGTGWNSFDMTFVKIGDPGNVPDAPRTFHPPNRGSVAYPYQMGKFEVSEGMINKFNASQFHQIDHDNRGPNKPATSVTWHEAAHFVNWLNTSQGHQAAYNIQKGYDKCPTFPRPKDCGVFYYLSAWNPKDAWQEGGENLFRHKDAQYWLPSYDEWYKATYYDLDSGNYFKYPTADGSEPIAVASGVAPNTAVLEQNLDTGIPADVTKAGGLNQNGIMALCGNVNEWIDEITETIPHPFDSRRDQYKSLVTHTNFSSYGEECQLRPPIWIDDRSTDEDRGGFRVVRRAPPRLPGDYNADGFIDVSDINLQTIEMNSLLPDLDVYDENNDGFVTIQDRHIWVETHKNTWMGDANLDGAFDTTDLIVVFVSGKYEMPVSAKWTDGDWNGDFRFTAQDIITAFADGGYQMGSRSSVAAVPEPSSMVLLLIGTLLLGRVRYKTRRNA